MLKVYQRREKLECASPVPSPREFSKYSHSEVINKCRAGFTMTLLQLKLQNPSLIWALSKALKGPQQQVQMVGYFCKICKSKILLLQLAKPSLSIPVFPLSQSLQMVGGGEVSEEKVMWNLALENSSWEYILFHFSDIHL